ETTRKYLPLREHCFGQRIEAALPSDGDRYMGSHRSRFDQAVRVPSLLPGPGAWRTLHTDRSVLPLVEGKAIRLSHPLYRVVGRGQYVHAISRGGGDQRCAESAAESRQW